MVRLCRCCPRARFAALAPFFALALLALSTALSAPGISRATPISSTPGTPGSENMALVGQVGGVSRAVAVAGDIAYLGVGPRLVALDVSNPAAPVLLGRSAVLPGVINAVVVTQTFICWGAWD